MKLKLALILAGAVVGLALNTAAHAAPFVNIQILGSTDGTNYSSHLTVTPGETISYEIIASLAPINTTDTHGTITTQTAGVDGINSLKFNLTDNGGGTFVSQVLQSGWMNGSGASAGTLTAGVLSGIRPIQAPGIFVGINSDPTVLLTGSFVVGTGNESIVGTWFPGGAGSGKYNNGAGSMFISGTTETGSDPYVGYAPLVLSNAVTTPEPASLGIIALGAASLLTRRRQA